MRDLVSQNEKWQRCMQNSALLCKKNCQVVDKVTVLLLCTLAEAINHNDLGVYVQQIPVVMYTAYFASQYSPPPKSATAWCSYRIDTVAVPFICPHIMVQVVDNLAHACCS